MPIERCRVLTLGVAVALAAALVATAAPARAADTLGAAAARSGRVFGAAVADQHLDDPVYAAVLDREFTSVTAENAMKWEVTEPARGAYRFGPGDRVVRHARARGMAIRGHALVWHRQLPDWVTGLSGDDLRAAMTDHITALVRRWRGDVDTWDVVNEAFEDRSDARRASVFQRELGDGYVEEAFRAARAADPDAVLCYNDYGIEDLDDAKTRAVLEMVRDLVARGVPIDCVGLQSHVDRFSPVPATFQDTLEAFAALGVEVQVTELDVEGSGWRQAITYRRVVQACRAVPACTSITVWGVADRYSWRAASTPLLFDDDHGAKPAHHAVLAALDVTPPVTVFAIEGDEATGTTVRLTATDATSGVADTEWRLDDGRVRAYDEPVLIDEPGWHSVAFRSTDGAGNAEPWQSVAVAVADGAAGPGAGDRSIAVVVESGCRPPSVVAPSVVAGVARGVGDGGGGGDGVGGGAAGDRVDHDGRRHDRGALARHFTEVARDVAADGVIDARQRAASLCTPAERGGGRPSSAPPPAVPELSRTGATPRAALRRPAARPSSREG